MHLDVSRNTFDPIDQFLRVVREQGSVDLDADANEQTAILLHRLHQLAADVYGPHWGPAADAGFKVKMADDPTKAPWFTVSRGRYYVGGLCAATDPEPEKPQALTYSAQPYYPFAEAPPAEPYLVYLEVWERAVSEAERLPAAGGGAGDPGLGDVPAAPRTRPAWRVRAKPLTAAQEQELTAALDKLEPSLDTTGDAAAQVKSLQTYLAALAALPAAGAEVRAQLGKLAPPPARPEGHLAARSAYRTGYDDQAPPPPFPVAEPANQLYRVEVHRGGKAVPLDPSPAGGPAAQNLPDVSKAATFKWSRENGAVTFPVHPKWLAGVKPEGWALDPVPGRGPAGRQVPEAYEVKVRLRTAPRDDEPGLQEGDVVEYCDPVTTFRTGPLKDDDPRRLLFRVDRIEVDDTADPDEPEVRAVLRAPAPGTGAAVPADAGRWAFLRRWDNSGVPLDRTGLRDTARGPVLADDGALLVVAPPDPLKQPTGWLDLDGVVQVRFEAGPKYQPGDYWLIPTRAATGDVIWPRTPAGKDKPEAPKDVAATPAADVYLAPLAVVTGGKPRDLRQLAVTPPLAPR